MNLLDKFKLVFSPKFGNIVEDLERFKASLDTKDSVSSDSIRQNIIGLQNILNKGDLSNVSLRNSIATGLLATYSQVNSDRAAYAKDFDEVKAFYITDTLLGTFADDALTPDVTSGEIVDLISTDPKINSELAELQRNIDIDQLVNDIVLDLLAYGEYSVRVIMDDDISKGIAKIVDDVDQSTILALYDSGLPGSFLVNDKRTIRIVNPSEYIHFTLGKHKLRLNLIKFIEENTKSDAAEVKKLLEGLPTYIRVGRPIFFGVIGKIKELMLLEGMIPTEVFNSIVAGSLVQLRLPASMTPKDGFDACREFENLLNSKVGVDRGNGQVSVTDIISVAGKIKVIPSFGDKGDITKLNDIKNNATIEDLMRSIKDIRETITSSLGFPSELLYGGDFSKGDLLKRYARYLRKLKAIQTSVANGLKQLAFVHLVNKGFDINQSSVTVRFRNEIVNIDELDKLEFFDAIISITDRFNTFINALAASEELKPDINKDKFYLELKKYLKLLGSGEDIINVSEPKKKKLEPGDID